MAKTYLAMTNELLVEINEPELTAITGAVGVQKQVANCVNRAYFDIVDAVDDWSWLSTDVPDDPYYGNTIVDCVVGQRSYLLKAGSANVDADFDSVNWDMFTLKLIKFISLPIIDLLHYQQIQIQFYFQNNTNQFY